MKKIAILRCLKSNDVCTGAACLKAVNENKGTFAVYGDEQLKLVAFFSCNGCEEVLLRNQEGFDEKISMIKSLKPDVIHVGVCCWQRSNSRDKVLCEKILEINRHLENMGINVIYGTH